jgi:hypothetical protein
MVASSSASTTRAQVAVAAADRAAEHNEAFV